jgi:hypothetical protein
MNDLHKCLKYSHNTLFVDDVTLAVSGNFCDIYNTIDNLGIDLENVNTWLRNRILELNDDKSTVMFIGRPHTLQSLGDPKIYINGKTIKRVYVTKVLGVLIDDYPSWVPPTTTVTQVGERMCRCSRIFQQTELRDFI